MSIGQLLNRGVRRGGHTSPNSLTARTLSKHVREIPKLCPIIKGILPKGCLFQKKEVRLKNKAFAHLKYSNDDYGGFKAAAARPHPHLHHQTTGSRLPQLSSQQDHLCLLQHPSCPAKLQQHSRPPRRPAGNCAWKQKAGSSTAAPTCSGAQLLPCRSCSTMVPLCCGPTVVSLSFHSPAVAFLAACSDLPSLHLACFLLIYVSPHALIPQ